jgi:hypothetical protein
MKSKIIIIGIILLNISIFVHSTNYATSGLHDSINKIKPIQMKLGVGSGWKAPYGTGLNIGIRLYEIIELDAGGGLGSCGLKAGLGTRIIPLRNSTISPMLSIHYNYTAGMNSVKVNVNDDEGIYKYNPNSALIANAGISYKVEDWVFVLIGLGYSLPFEDQDAILIDGSDSEAVESFANALGIGGFSFSIGASLSLTKELFGQ